MRRKHLVPVVVATIAEALTAPIETKQERNIGYIIERKISKRERLRRNKANKQRKISRRRNRN